MQKSTTANDARNYIVLIIGVLIGLVGVYFRFFGDSFFYTAVSNAILVIAVIICLHRVFIILE